MAPRGVGAGTKPNATGTVQTMRPWSHCHGCWRGWTSSMEVVTSVFERKTREGKAKQHEVQGWESEQRTYHSIQTRTKSSWNIAWLWMKLRFTVISTEARKSQFVWRLSLFGARIPKLDTWMLYVNVYTPLRSPYLTSQLSLISYCRGPLKKENCVQAWALLRWFRDTFSTMEASNLFNCVRSILLNWWNGHFHTD